MRDNYYKTLQVWRDATPMILKTSYRRLAKQTHPDFNKGDDAEFKKIAEAYEVLSDDLRRNRYDAERSQFIRQSGLIACSKCFAAIRMPHEVPEGKYPYCKECNAPIDMPKSDRAHSRKKKLSPVAEKALQVVDEIGVEVTEIAGEAILAGIRQLRKKIKG